MTECQVQQHLYNPRLDMEGERRGRKLKEELARQREAGEENLVIHRGKIIRLLPEDKCQRAGRPEQNDGSSSDAATVMDYLHVAKFIIFFPLN